MGRECRLDIPVTGRIYSPRLVWDGLPEGSSSLVLIRDGKPGNYGDGDDDEASPFKL